MTTRQRAGERTFEVSDLLRAVKDVLCEPEMSARRRRSRVFRFNGLDAFKAKFNPEVWEPIYAVAEGASFPPRALYSIAGAFSAMRRSGLC